MMAGTVRSSLGRFQQFLLDRLKPLPILRDLVKQEWTSVATFVLLMPYQLFYFLWLMTGGPMSEYGFFHRYISYLHLLVFLISVAMARVAIEPSIQQQSSDSISLSSNINIEPIAKAICKLVNEKDSATKLTSEQTKSKPKSI